MSSLNKPNLRLVQTCVKRSKIENFLIGHDLRVRKIGQSYCELRAPSERTFHFIVWTQWDQTGLNIAIRANFFPIGQFFDGIYLPLGNILCTLGKKISKLINYWSKFRRIWAIFFKPSGHTAWQDSYSTDHSFRTWNEDTAHSPRHEQHCFLSQYEASRLCAI